MDDDGLNPMENINHGFELHDFIDDPNFDQFIDLIRGENEDPLASFDCDDLINGSFIDNQFGPIPNPEAADHQSTFGYDATMLADPNSFHVILPDYDVEIMVEDNENDQREDSSGTTTTTTTNTGKKPKVDRSRTLISERRRRGRMKDKLYALRSLVPNITKMDKASIVGDAVLYIEDMQMQANKLKAEIVDLEASLSGAERNQGSKENPKSTNAAKANNFMSKTIIQMDMVQVEERGFYVKVVCKSGGAAAISLYKALESLTSYNIQNSNIATVSDRFVLTFTLNVKECEQNLINFPNLKLRVSEAFVNQGFELKIPFSI